MERISCAQTCGMPGKGTVGHEIAHGKQPLKNCALFLNEQVRVVTIPSSDTAPTQRSLNTLTQILVRTCVGRWELAGADCCARSSRPVVARRSYWSGASWRRQRFRTMRNDSSAAATLTRSHTRGATIAAVIAVAPPEPKRTHRGVPPTSVRRRGSNEQQRDANSSRPVTYDIFSRHGACLRARVRRAARGLAPSIPPSKAYRTYWGSCSRGPIANVAVRLSG